MRKILAALAILCGLAVPAGAANVPLSSLSAAAALGATNEFPLCQGATVCSGTALVYATITQLDTFLLSTSGLAGTSGGKFGLLNGNLTLSGNNTYSGTAALSGGGSLAGTFSGTPTLSGNLTFSGTPIFSGLSAGTCANNLVLDSGNNLVTATCSSGGGLTINSTTISGGASGKVLYDDGTKLQELPYGLTGNSTIVETTSGGLLTASILPLGTNAAKGAVEGDGSTITCVAGVCTAIGAAASAIDAGGATSISNGTAGRSLFDSAGNVGVSSGLTQSTTKVLSMSIGLGSDATGDTYYNGGSGAFTRLAIGATGNVQTVVAGIPAWSTGLTLSATKITAASIGLGSDATGDIYYNGGSGAFTRLAVGTGTQVLHGGTTPAYSAIAAGDLPLATNAAIGGMKGDGQTVTCASGICSGTSPDVTKTSGYTLTAADMGGQVVYNGSSITATIPAISSTIFATGMSATIININATPLTISSTPTINGLSGTTLGQYEWLSCVSNNTSLDCTTNHTLPTVNTLTISTATFTPDLGAGVNQKATLVHASCPCTIANPSNISTRVGQTGMLDIIQSSTGSDTVGTWGSQYITPGGTSTLTLSTGANAIDHIAYRVIDSTHVLLSAVMLNATH
jgi:hypothetical protein